MNNKFNLIAEKSNYLFMSEKVQFSQRLRLAIEAAGYPLRPTMIEREFNTRYWGSPITVQAIRRWLRGEAIPSQEKLQVLAEWLKIEPHTLRFGAEAAQSIRAKRQKWEDALDHREREAIEQYLSLPIEQRKLVREVILICAKANASQPQAL